MIRLGALTVTVVNRTAGAADRYNNPTLAATGTYDLTGCNLQQRTSDEELVNADTTITSWVLFTPPIPAGKTIKATDLIRIAATAAHTPPDEGQTYATFELDGEPDHLDHINGQTHHLELILRRAQL